MIEIVAASLVVGALAAIEERAELGSLMKLALGWLVGLFASLFIVSLVSAVPLATLTGGWVSVLSSLGMFSALLAPFLVAVVGTAVFLITAMVVKVFSDM